MVTPEPGGPRTKEVEVAQQLLQTMGFRTFVPVVAACPGCGRTTSTLFQEMAQNIQNHLTAKMPEWRKTYPGVETLTVAVMGCIVNGPGESKHADIGISLPGTGESPAAPVFIDGRKAVEAGWMAMYFHHAGIALPDFRNQFIKNIGGPLHAVWSTNRTRFVRNGHHLPHDQNRAWAALSPAA